MSRSKSRQSSKSHRSSRSTSAGVDRRHRHKSDSKGRDRERENRRKSRERSPERSNDRTRERSRDRSRDRSRERSHERSPHRVRRHEDRKDSSYARSRSNNKSLVYTYRTYSTSRSRSRSIGFSSGDARRRRIYEKPEKTRCLGVFGLSGYTTERQITEIFSKYGEIERVNVVYDAKSGRSRGFCFVYFDRLEDAVVAKESSSGLEIDYRRIRVDYSITQRPHTPTPGIYKGRPINRSDGDRYHQRRRRSNSSSPGPRRRAPRSPSRSHSRR